MLEKFIGTTLSVGRFVIGFVLEKIVFNAIYRTGVIMRGGYLGNLKPGDIILVNIEAMRNEARDAFKKAGYNELDIRHLIFMGKINKGKKAGYKFQTSSGKTLFFYPGFIRVHFFDGSFKKLKKVK